MEKKLSDMLGEIYAVDPSLRDREADLIRILNELIANRLDVKLNPEFAARLRQRLERTADQGTKQMENDHAPVSFLDRFLGLRTASLVAVLVLVVVLVGFSWLNKNPGSGLLTDNSGTTSNPIQGVTFRPAKGLVAFADTNDFSDYMQQSMQLSGGIGMGGGGIAIDMMRTDTDSQFGAELKMAAQPIDGTVVGRYSQTNTQVLGIDEPDIVKTNGRELYWSRPQSYIYDCIRPMEGTVESSGAPVRIMPPGPCGLQVTAGTDVISLSDPKMLKAISRLDTQGDILLDGDSVVVQSYNQIVGYDMSNPDQPKRNWTIDLDNQTIAASRLADHQLYLVLQNNRAGAPCPLPVMKVRGADVAIPCTEIYHPVEIVPAATTYSVFKVDPKDGSIKARRSFVGSSGQSVVYMGSSALYVTYSFNADIVPIVASFLHSDGKSIFPQSVVDRIDKLANYDISTGSKQIEVQNIIQTYLSGLSSDQQVTVQNNFTNAFSDFANTHRREFQTTGIVKINIKDLSVGGTGSVPGQPINQFALDEYQGNLRIATTVGGGWFGIVGGQISQTTGDVYVLDGGMKMQGAVKDLGENERIYSVRFIGDRGYVVTFRQTDPFFVLDLKNPKAPAIKGQLKIPGYSSYLHPLTDDRILGVGMENGRVKLSLFSVSDPSNPTEVSHYSLNEYWSEASNNHHAFLQDSKHGVFFMPGGQSGYVFAYGDDNLRLEKTVAGVQARRAVYVNDNLFIVSDAKITVVDENNWETLSTFTPAAQ